MASECKTFKPDTESVEEFLERYKCSNYDKIEAAAQNRQKLTMLLVNCLPVDVVNALQRKLKPAKLTAATYENLETLLISSYTVKKSVVGAAVTFVNRKQKPQESIEDYSKTLNELASRCEYSDCCRNRMLRDVFVSGLRSPKIMSAVITEAHNKNFEECINKAKLIEQVTKDVDDINPSNNQRTQLTNRVESSNGSSNKYSNNSNNTRNNKSSNNNQFNDNRSRQVPQDYKCYRCGTIGKHFVNKCFAIELVCDKCNVKGHIARACRNTRAKKSNHIASSQDYHRDSRSEPPEETDQCDYITMNTIKYSSRNNSRESIADLDREFPPLVVH